jgi:prevent-host-death family protein
MLKKQQPMTRSVTALLARTHFGQIIDRVSQNDARFVVTKNGQARAVILGIEDFLQTVKALPESVAELEELVRKGDTHRLMPEEIGEEIVRGAKPKQQRVTQGTEEGSME